MVSLSQTVLNNSTFNTFGYRPIYYFGAVMQPLSSKNAINEGGEM